MWLKRPKRTLSEFGFTNFSGDAADPAVQAKQAQNANAYRSYVDTKKADARKQFLQAGLTAAAVVGAPAAFGAVGGGAASGGATLPAAATQGVGFSAAPGAGMTLGKLWDIGNLGLQGASAFFGQRSQNRALDKQMALQREEINARMLADAEARAEQKRQFDAQQANEARRYAAEDEDRLFTRRILEDREARLGAKRAYADRARQRLFQFLGLG